VTQLRVSKNELAGRPQPTLLLPAISLDPLVDGTVRGGLVERLLNILYVLGSIHFRVTSADVRVNISRSTVASPWSVIP